MSLGGTIVADFRAAPRASTIGAGRPERAARAMTGGIQDWTSHRSAMNDALRIDRGAAVALTIDMQRAYLDPAVGRKTLPAPVAAAVVAASARLLAACRTRGIPVVHAYVNREPLELETRLGNSRFATLSKGIASGGATEAPDRPAGSPEAELAASIAATGDIHIRSKKTTDSYLGTELGVLFEQVIRPSVVIILGINTETCVYAGAFGTKVRGYRPVIATDCVGSHRDPENSRLALELMSRTIAWTLASDEIIAKLDAD
jgi:nicotinamidase-related amidase